MSNPIIQSSSHFKESRNLIKEATEKRVPHRFIKIVHDPSHRTDSGAGQMQNLLQAQKNPSGLSQKFLQYAQHE